MKLTKLKTPLIIVVALLMVVGIANAVTLNMSPKEAKDFVAQEDCATFAGMDINLIENVTTSNASVGTTTTEVVAANVARKYLAIVNDSDEAVYISIDENAVMNEGIRLNANGGTFEMNQDNLSFKAINGICTSGSKNVTITEGY